jgi:hypothetical protein
METDFFDLLNETIQHYKFLHYDNYGRPVTSTAFNTYRARVVYTAKKKRDKSRDATELEKIQSAIIYVNSTGVFSLEDIVLIREGFRPRIIMVEAYPDERDTYHHVKLTCGD